jgi:predicted house-cleaning noncanonical NTP pyrophosphatase (MazG superfamily)
VGLESLIDVDDLINSEPEFQDEQSELEYKEKVVQNLLENIEEYLTFSTARELWKLIAANL